MRRGPAVLLRVLPVAAVLLTTAVRIGADGQFPPAFAGTIPLPLRGGPGLMPADNSAVVIGSVIDRDTGKGVSRAIVRLSGRDVSRVFLSDDNGRFDFLALPRGAYTVTASKAGFFDGAYGKLRAGGTGVPLSLENGQWVTSAAIPVFRPATVSGVVVDEDNEPVVGVRVQALRRQMVAGHPRVLPGPSTLTDDRGEYRLVGLMPGEYVIAVPSMHITLPALGVAAIAAIVGGASGTGRAGNAPPDVASVVSNALRGPVFDALMGPTTTTADATGSTVVVSGRTAIPPPPVHGRPLAYPTVYYPTTSEMRIALPIDVASGEHRAAVNFELHAVPMVRVSGRISTPSGEAPGEILRLVPLGADDFGLGTEAGTTIADIDGSFTFLDVPAGSYVVEARSALSLMLASSEADEQQAGLLRAVSTSPFASAHSFGSSSNAGTLVTASLGGQDTALWGDAEVVVGDTDVSDLVVPLSAGAAIGGTIALEGRTAPPVEALAKLTIVAEPADGTAAMPPPAHLDADGGFIIPGATSGRYFIRAAGLPAGWSMKSAISHGRDLSDEPLDTRAGADASDLVVTLTDHATQLTGTVRDAHGVSTPLATVIVFPADPTGFSDYGLNPRRLVESRVGVNGTFTVSGLPAGDYDVVAIDEAGADGWQDPARLTAWRRVAAHIHLASGDTKSLDLTLTSDHRPGGPV